MAIKVVSWKSKKRPPTEEDRFFKSNCVVSLLSTAAKLLTAIYINPDKEQKMTVPNHSLFRLCSNPGNSQKKSLKKKFLPLIPVLLTINLTFPTINFNFSFPHEPQIIENQPIIANQKSNAP